MKAVLVETSRGATVGLMIGLLVGFFCSLTAGVGFYLGFGMVACMGLFGVGLAVLMVVFRRAVQLGGVKRIAMRGLGGAIVGFILGPLLYLWGWCDALIYYTIGIVVILTICAALNEALDILAEKKMPGSAEV